MCALGERRLLWAAIGSLKLRIYPETALTILLLGDLPGTKTKRPYGTESRGYDLKPCIGLALDPIIKL